LTGSEASKIFDTSQERIQAAAALTSDKGLGQRVIVSFLDGVPGINIHYIIMSFARRLE